MQVVDAIARSHYIATDAQVETLASLVADGKKASGTYLNVLVAHVLEEIGRRKLSRKQIREAVTVVNDRLYPHVLKGVGPDDMNPKERNRRATFARSACADLRKFIRKGGDIRKQELGKISKHVLRTYGERVPTGTRTERAFARASDSVLRSVRRIGQGDQKKARKLIAEVQSELQALLKELAKQPKVQRPVKRASRRPAVIARPRVYSPRAVGGVAHASM